MAASAQLSATIAATYQTGTRDEGDASPRKTFGRSLPKSRSGSWDSVTGCNGPGGAIPHEGVRVTNIGFGYRLDEDATEVEYEGWATIGGSMRRGRGASRDDEEEKRLAAHAGQLLDRVGADRRQKESR